MEKVQNKWAAEGRCKRLTRSNTVKFIEESSMKLKPVPIVINNSDVVSVEVLMEKRRKLEFANPKPCTKMPVFERENLNCVS